MGAYLGSNFNLESFVLIRTYSSFLSCYLWAVIIRPKEISGVVVNPTTALVLLLAIQLHVELFR